MSTSFNSVHIGGSVNAEVELWDCGSSGNVESCWPIFAKDLNGLVFVYNEQLKSRRRGRETTVTVDAEARAHQKCLETLYNNFVYSEGGGGGVRDSQCLIVDCLQKHERMNGSDDDDHTDDEDDEAPTTKKV